MSKTTHQYGLEITWTGNNGSGTSGYKNYERNYSICSMGKPEIYGSSDPIFRGDASRYNPEELLLAALSSCHMLWYLHLCAEAGVVVTDYVDKVSGQLMLNKDGSGAFSEAVLSPYVTITDPTMKEQALLLHQQAQELCFIARSVNFPVHHKAQVTVLE